METDGSSSSSGSSRAEELLSMQLRQNEALQLGTLDNGLRFVILPNRSPPARFEAHLEVHAGSGALAVCVCGYRGPVCGGVGGWWGEWGGGGCEEANEWSHALLRDAG